MENNVEFLELGNISLPVSDLVPLLIQYQMLPNLLREIIIDRAIVDINYTSSEVSEALTQFKEKQQITTPEQLQSWLNFHFMTPEQLERVVIRQVQIEKFKQESWGNKTESYFITRKTLLDKVIYSLIRTNDLGIAQEVYFRLIDGEQSFEEAARKYSMGAESETGGLIGPVELSTPHPVIGKLLASSSPGHICPPIKLEQWYVIVRLDKMMPVQLDEPMRQRLINELFQTWIQEEIKRIHTRKSELTAQAEYQ
jgi:parvulin-like peptidyl-prolyl isomerase